MTTPTIKDSTSTSYIPKFDPDTQSWKSYDKKVCILGIDLEYYEEILTTPNLWDEESTSTPGTKKYDKTQIAKMKKADGFARKVYILGSTKKTEPYMVGETAYEVRKKLMENFEPMDTMGLAKFHKDYVDLIKVNPYENPDILINEMQYISQRMFEARGTL